MIQISVFFSILPDVSIVLYCLSYVLILMILIKEPINYNLLGTAHYLWGGGGAWGWKYSIWGNNFFVKASIQGSNIFQNIYTRQGLFGQKMKAVQGVVDGCIYQGKK